MTEAERQQVIDALERAVGTCFTEYAHRQFMSDPKHFMNEALAIMRREREQAKKDADSHAEQQAIAARNRAVVDLVYSSDYRQG